MKVALIARTMLTDEGLNHVEAWREDQGRGSEAEVLAEIAGRTCYDSGGQGRSSSDFHKHIIEAEHGNVHAHASVTVQISEISRNLSHELVRHHVGCNPSQRSTRYCDETESKTIIHPLITAFINDPDADFQDRVELKAALVALDEHARKVYAKGVELLQNYKVPGAIGKAGRKQARAAMARHLPHGIETEVTWTMNMRAARNFVEQRFNNAADAEIRQLASMIYDILVKDSPKIFGDYRHTDDVDGLGHGVVTDHRKI